MYLFEYTSISNYTFLYTVVLCSFLLKMSPFITINFYDLGIGTEHNRPTAKGAA